MSRPRILNAEPDRYSPRARAALEEVAEVTEQVLDREGLLKAIGEYQGLIVRLGHRIDEPVLAAARRLRVITTPTTGLDHIDLKGARARGIEVLSLRGESEFLRGVVATAEHTWALLLALVRRLPPAAAAVRAGIPLLDYRGHVGFRHNPIAIAQWGLGNHDLWLRGGGEARRARFLRAAGWLLDNLEPNEVGLHVWPHRFQWEYQTLLPYGWYSALAQGQGLSLLLRAHRATGEARWLDAAERVLETFFHEMEAGGIVHTDERGDLWLEEVILQPPTYILNGMMWASWGLYDHWVHTGSGRARTRWEESVATLLRRLGDFDIGYWSLYDIAGTPLPNVASPFYHALHVVQLRVTKRLSGETAFGAWAERWDRFQRGALRPRLAWAHKALFKLLYY